MVNIVYRAGYTAPSGSCYKLDQRYLDGFHAAVLGDKWPKRWRWDLTSDPANRPGVQLDEHGRVVILDLDFGDQIGEA